MYFSKTTNILRNAIWLLALATVCVLMAGAAATLLLKRMDKELYAVQSGSMEPTISRGDAVIVSTKMQSLKSGDVATFIASDGSGRLITHRILDVDTARGTYITKGDGTEAVDEPIAASQIIGRAERSVPYVGSALDFFRKPIGLVTALYIPAGILIAGEINRLSRYFGAGQYRLYGYRRYDGWARRT